MHSKAIFLRALLYEKLAKIVLTIGFIAAFFCQNSYSQETMILYGPEKTYKFQNEVSYFLDQKRQFTFEEVLSMPQQKAFIYPGNKSVNFGVGNWNAWFKVDVKNGNPSLENEWMFDLAYPHYDSLEFYNQNEKGEWQKHLTGDRTPFNTRKIFNKHFAFPISLSDTLTRTYYFHIMGEGSLQFPLFIQSRDYFFATQERISTLYGGIFFGIIFIMLLYNLFIYFSLKDRVYLYYVFFSASVLFFYLGYSGYGNQYIWGFMPWVNAKIIPLGVILTGISCTVFSMSFLETQRYAPWIQKIMIGTLIGYALELVVIAFLDYKTSLILCSLLATISASLILFTSYRVWFKGNKSARFMAIAFSSYFIGIMLLTANIQGFLSRNFIVSHSMEIGTAIEITLLSLALSDKYSRLKKEKEEAQSQLIKIQQIANEELEKKVEKRTLQINQQKLELQESNRVKDKLLSIISHDLKGPLNAFQSLLSMMLKDELTQEKISMYTLHLNNKLGLMVSLVDNILHWVRSQMEGMKFDVQPIKLKDLVKENVNLFSSQAELKHIKIVDEVPENTLLLGDKNVVRLVIRNLLANALKFTETGGEVHISSTENGAAILTEIRDTGVGMDEDKISKLFTDAHFTTPDTNQKEGTGLGLLLCKEFLAKTSGEIWAESKPGKGSSFKFTLPKA